MTKLSFHLQIGLVQLNISQFNCASNKKACLVGEFDCGEGTCIERDRLCNGVPDCPDGYDEENCPDSPAGPVTGGYVPEEYDTTTPEIFLATESFDFRTELPDYYPEQTTTEFCKSYICCVKSKHRSA